MRAVVTGGAGFLGSHVCERLIREGWDVLCIDNILTGSLSNIAHLIGNGLTFMEQDVNEKLVVEGSVGAVLHFASPASPRDYLRYPIETLKVGSVGTLRTLEFAKAKGAIYLLASTSEVYGDSEVHPQSESYWGRVNPIGPRGVYDESKRFSEASVSAYHRVYNLDVRIARIFNTYGPRMRINDGRAVSNFIVQALQGKPLTVYGDGTQTRSFCYVSDLVDAIKRFLTVKEHGPVNIGNPEETRIIDLARCVLEITGRKNPITFCPLPEDDPRVRQPDITRAMLSLGWKPQVSLRQGLEETVAYFRECIGS
ncbi:MAG: UDP-glucuronic acid decarboxylase family protein [Candidatus Methylomirabilales bacterium]